MVESCGMVRDPCSPALSASELQGALAQLMPAALMKNWFCYNQPSLRSLVTAYLGNTLGVLDLITHGCFNKEEYAACVWPVGGGGL